MLLGISSSTLNMQMLLEENNDYQFVTVGCLFDLFNN